MFKQSLTKIIILILFFSSSAYSMSFGQAKIVFAALSSASKTHLVFKLNPTDVVNAQEYDGIVEINRGMLKFVHNPNELAMVLGHEIGHYVLGHTRSTPANEYAADAYGAILAAKAGYDRCTGALIIKRFHDPSSSTHPASDLRYKRIKC